MKKQPSPVLLPDGIHLSHYLDEEMEGSIREEFVRSIDLNPQLRDEVDGLRTTIAVLNRMPCRAVPDDEMMVKECIPRHRLRPLQVGLSSDFGRLPVEAVFHLILIGLMLALYIVALPAVDVEVEPVSRETSGSASESLD